MNSVKTVIEKDVQVNSIYYWTGSKVCLSSEKSFNVSVDIEFRKLKGYQTNFHGAYRQSENNPSNLLTKMGFPLSQLREKIYGGRDLIFSRNTIIN